MLIVFSNFFNKMGREYIGMYFFMKKIEELWKNGMIFESYKVFGGRENCRVCEEDDRILERIGVFHARASKYRVIVLY